MALIAQLVIGCSDDASEPTQPVSDVDRAPTIGIWPNAHERVPPPGDLCAYLLTLEQQADEFRARVAESNVTALTIPITWSSVDPGDGSGPDYSRSPLLLGAIAEGYDVFVNLAPIWSDAYTMPADLGEAPFSEEAPANGGPSPVDRTIERGRLLVTELDRQVPGARERIKYLSLANELDGFIWYLRLAAFARGEPAKPFPWNGFARYVREVSRHAREVFQEAQITVTFSMNLVSFPELHDHVFELREDTDALAMNYYELPSTFGQIESTHDEFAALYPDWPIVYQEVGFLAPKDGEQRQIDFVEEAFRFGGSATPKVSYMGFFSLHDWHLEPEPCDEPTAPNACNPCVTGCRWCGSANRSLFERLLSTVGLLRDDGTPKPVWEPFKALAAEFAQRNR